MKINPWAIGFFIILALFVANECNRKEPETKVVTRTVIQKGDSIPYEVEIIKKEREIIYRDTGSVRWREMDIDTLAILDEFFTINYYHDTLMNDTSAFISVQSYVFQNRLWFDKLFFQNRREKAIHTTNITTHIHHPPGRFYLGTGVGRNPEEFDFTANVLYLGPKRIGLGGQYGIMSGDIYLTAYLKLGK
jgi:hypothetical protein